MKKQRDIANKYFNVVTAKNGDAADIFLYGYIGQSAWWGEDPEEDITDLAFVRALTDLEAKHNRINIRINSPGGSMYHGNAIINAIQRSKAEIHTYNDGLAASMAGGIWLAVPKAQRHMSSSGLLMIHSPINMSYGNARDLRNDADVLDAFATTIISVVAAESGKTEEEIKAQYFNYEDHWLTGAQAKADGLLTNVESYKVQPTPPEPQNMHPIALMEHYRDAINAAPVQHESKLGDLLTGFIASLQNLITPPAAAQAKTPDMNLEELKTSLADGTLTRDAVQALLDSVAQPAATAPAAPAPAAAAPAPAAPAATAPAATTEPAADPFATLTAKLTELQNKLEELATGPAAGPSNGPAPDATDAEPELAQLRKDYAAQQNAWADAGQKGLVRFGS